MRTCYISQYYYIAIIECYSRSTSINDLTDDLDHVKTQVKRPHIRNKLKCLRVTYRCNGIGVHWEYYMINLGDTSVQLHSHATCVGDRIMKV